MRATRRAAQHVVGAQGLGQVVCTVSLEAFAAKLLQSRKLGFYHRL